MTSKELRQKFLGFFEKKGHKVVPSSSLLPTDPSVLFTTAGMQQFKPYFSGEKSPYGDKVASCQKCFRTSDIDEVGDESHLTFFEMLGNFSFGAYFKKETIGWAIEFLTKELKVDKNRLWFTYFKGNRKVPEDKESYQILTELEIPKDRIYAFDKDNFWGPTGLEGPCGPTVEIHYDLSQKPCRKGKDCIPNCDCGRFIELWNLVFNEYYQDKDGKLNNLPQKGVDTGMGLERLAMVVQNKANVFETDLFLPLIEQVAKESRKTYREFPQAFRIIADHIKASVFLITQGVLPSKEEKGYVLRRLLRRAIRYAKMIELEKYGLIEVAKKVIEIYGNVYPELEGKINEVITVIQGEDEKFSKTIERGMKEFEKVVKPDKKVITGKEAFYLYETYGFPLELLEEMAREKGLGVDRDGFFEAQKEHQTISRQGAERKFGGVGIEKLKAKSEKLKATKLHTATHLLQAALRQVLGDQVHQMGSDITPERLRFDFNFPRKLTSEEIKKVEQLVNEAISRDLPVIKKMMPKEEALKAGALAFFKEKYPEIVSVYIIGDFKKPFSMEICAGPHVDQTNKLGYFKIVKEKSVGAGIRRIKAVLKDK